MSSETDKKLPLIRDMVDVLNLDLRLRYKAKAGEQPQEKSAIDFDADLADIRPGSLADEILNIVLAFPDQGRKNRIRNLAVRVWRFERSAVKNASVCEHKHTQPMGTEYEGVVTYKWRWCRDCGAVRRDMTDWRYENGEWKLPKAGNNANDT